MISITEASLIVKIPIIQLLLSYFLGQESVKLCKPFPASVRVKMCGHRHTGICCHDISLKASRKMECRTPSIYMLQGSLVSNSLVHGDRKTRNKAFSNVTNRDK